MDLRGGSHLIHDNTFTTKDKAKPNLGDFRDEESDPHNTPGVPLRSPVKWPCEDQITANFVWGNTLNGEAYNKLELENSATPATTVRRSVLYQGKQGLLAVRNLEAVRQPIIRHPALRVQLNIRQPVRLAADDQLYACTISAPSTKEVLRAYANCHACSNCDAATYGNASSERHS